MTASPGASSRRRRRRSLATPTCGAGFRNGARPAAPSARSSPFSQPASHRWPPTPAAHQTGQGAGERRDHRLEAASLNTTTERRRSPAEPTTHSRRSTDRRHVQAHHRSPSTRYLRSGAIATNVHCRRRASDIDVQQPRSSASWTADSMAATERRSEPVRCVSRDNAAPATRRQRGKPLGPPLDSHRAPSRAPMIVPVLTIRELVAQSGLKQRDAERQTPMAASPADATSGAGLATRARTEHARTRLKRGPPARPSKSRVPTYRCGTRLKARTSPTSTSSGRARFRRIIDEAPARSIAHHARPHRHRLSTSGSACRGVVRHPRRARRRRECLGGWCSRRVGASPRGVTAASCRFAGKNTRPEVVLSMLPSSVMPMTLTGLGPGGRRITAIAARAGEPGTAVSQCRSPSARHCPRPIADVDDRVDSRATAS